jgi:signal transduction histidine kinase
MPSTVPSLQHPRAHILVVEDDPATSAAVTSALQNEGYEVEAASDGDKALQRLRRAPGTDLIILDLCLPNLDGWQFRTIQRTDPALASIPVLAMSADGTPMAEAVDAAAFLHKPFRLADLLDRVERIVADGAQARARAHQTARLSALGTLAAGAVHEISNPLLCVLASLDALDRQLGQMTDVVSTGPVDDTTRTSLWNSLQGAQIGTDRICGVLRGLQSVSRRSNDRHRPIDLRGALQSALVLTAHQIRHCARVVEEIPPVLPLVRGSELGLGQVFTNLLINAAQAIGEGHAQANEIRVKVRTDERDVIVEISDTGCGLGQEARQRLFEAFFTTKAPGAGTGLGLTLCQGIVGEHNGTIEVESEEGQGSLFRVLLPIHRDPVVRDPTCPREPPILGRRSRVLIIDDDPEVAWGMKRILDREHDVTPVTHGQEALDRLLWGQTFDVILCNLNMPFMSSEEIYERMASRFGDDILGRLVFVTGGPITARARALLDRTPNPRLYKPFGGDELRALVRQMIARPAGWSAEVHAARSEGGSSAAKTSHSSSASFRRA